MTMSARAETKPAASPELQARALTQRARASMRLFDVDGYEEAVPLLREAVEAAPAYAPAYAALAETYSYWGFRREIGGMEAQSLYDMALENANLALNLAPDLAESHRAMAVALRRGAQADPDRRRAEVTTAMDMAPHDAETLWEHWRASATGPGSRGWPSNPACAASTSTWGRSTASAANTRRRCGS
jgi:tetratricopeptide (TPR) repeat protein